MSLYEIQKRSQDPQTEFSLQSKVNIIKDFPHMNSNIS